MDDTQKENSPRSGFAVLVFAADGETNRVRGDLDGFKISVNSMDIDKTYDIALAFVESSDSVVQLLYRNRHLAPEGWRTSPFLGDHGKTFDSRSGCRKQVRVLSDFSRWPDMFSSAKKGMRASRMGGGVIKASRLEGFETALSNVQRQMEGALSDGSLGSFRSERMKKNSSSVDPNTSDVVEQRGSQCRRSSLVFWW